LTEDLRNGDGMSPNGDVIDEAHAPERPIKSITPAYGPETATERFGMCKSDLRVCALSTAIVSRY